MNDPDKWLQMLSKQDCEVLFAALWAAKDVHAPTDNLSARNWERLEFLADYFNERLSK